MTFDFETEMRACPVCNSNAYRLQSRQDVFALVRCRDCGMLYTHNPPTTASKLAYYNEMARRRASSDAAVSRAFFTLANQIKSVPLYSNALCAIRNRYPQGTVHLVDVGCGGGLFLLGAQVAEDAFNIDRVPRFNISGVAFDPMEKRDTEKFAGCPVLMIEQAGEKLSHWADVVTMFNVLEHVNDPAKCLATAKRMLQDAGILVVDVPNNQVVSWRGRFLRRWPRLDLCEHINHFTPATLDRLMKSMGFELSDRLGGLVQAAAGFGLRTTLKQRLRWAVASVLFRATVKKFQVFPHMTVLYVKKPDKRA